MMGGSAKFWLWVFTFAIVVAVVLLIFPRRQRPAMPGEELRSMNSDANSQFESLTTQVQELTTQVQQLTTRVHEMTLEFEELNRSLQQRSPGAADQKELANQMNQLGLVQSNSSLVVQRLASYYFPDALKSPDQREQDRQESITGLREAVKEREKALEEAQQKVMALASGVPAEVQKTDIQSGLKDPTLEQYWPFFRARAQCNDITRLKLMLEWKLASEQADAASGK
jgi:DNA repair exonuclease SbcCD ATPase subunit